MTMANVQIDIPEELVQFTVLTDAAAKLQRNAMLVYPYIQNGTISHGKAAEMLGINKMSLIELYGSLGLPYFDMSEAELDEDLATLARLRG